MHPRVTVTIGDVDFAGGIQRHAGGTIERRGTPCYSPQTFPEIKSPGIAGVRRLVSGAQRHEQLALGSEFGDDMAPVIRNVDGIIRADAAAVGAVKKPLAPRSQQVPLPVEDHYRALAPVEDVHPVLRIGGDTADVFERPPFGEFCPPVNQLVSVFASTV